MNFLKNKDFKTIITWNELSQYDYNHPPKKGTFKRKNIIEFKKIIYEEKMKQKGYKNVDEYIYQKILKNGLKLYNIVPNKFPYNVPKNVYHLVLWLNPLYTFDKKNIENIINKEICPTKNIIIFENEANARSIKTIRHIHIFVKYYEKQEMIQF